MTDDDNIEWRKGYPPCKDPCTWQPSRCGTIWRCQTTGAEVRCTRYNVEWSTCGHGAGVTSMVYAAKLRASRAIAGIPQTRSSPYGS